MILIIKIYNIEIKIMTNQNNILNEEEIKELIGNLNRNPNDNEAEIRAVKITFDFALMHCSI